MIEKKKEFRKSWDLPDSSDEEDDFFVVDEEAEIQEEDEIEPVEAIPAEYREISKLCKE